MNRITIFLVAAAFVGLSTTSVAQATQGTSKPAAAGALAAYAPADICRAMVATLEQRDVGVMQTDHTASNVVVSFPARDGGATRNIKCHVDTEHGQAQWASDDSGWQDNAVSFRTDQAGDLVMQVRDMPARRFTRAELTKTAR
ncbi:hypothetical protein [Salinisphaera sp. Q1T1-3]|uniref:hypothetical protein n=1 Tax=Salinisphaera sp. Q1T1-3 TaxID=2321229 RepID=UPI000E7223EA|nr:hypothetical protein [Salinisphaera sp. Q1T1-3]RJS91437.1 hypothetical protein D3260_15675 [Salinisphaera sp. Q1T1-3]